MNKVRNVLVCMSVINNKSKKNYLNKSFQTKLLNSVE